MLLEVHLKGEDTLTFRAGQMFTLEVQFYVSPDAGSSLEFNLAGWTSNWRSFVGHHVKQEVVEIVEAAGALLAIVGL